MSDALPGAARSGNSALQRAPSCMRRASSPAASEVPARSSGVSSGAWRAASTSSRKGVRSRLSSPRPRGGPFEVVAQLRGGRQAVAPRRLRREARQIVRRRVEAADHLRIDQGRECGAARSAPRSAASSVAPETTTRSSDVGRAEVGAQLGVDALLRGRDRAQARRARGSIGWPRPASARRAQSRRARVRAPTARAPAPGARAAACRDPSAERRRHRGSQNARGSKLRQNEAGDRCGRDQAADRISAQLRQARKARGQERGEAAHRGQHAEPNGRPQPPLPGAAAGVPPRADCTKK